MNQRPSPVSAYLLLAFLTFLNILNFVDRQLIPSLAPMLMKDLGLSRAEIGLLFGYVFLAFYTVMGMALGAVADRSNRPRLIAVGLALWSALTAASGAALNFTHLALARMLVGVGEATLTPAAVSMISDVIPPKRRALASGIYYAGVPLAPAPSGTPASRAGFGHLLRRCAARRGREHADFGLDRAALRLAGLFLRSWAAGTGLRATAAAHQKPSARTG